jgi:hypothetical protein
VTAEHLDAEEFRRWRNADRRGPVHRSQPDEAETPRQPARKPV